ncbi:hypothetical protein E2542_SST08006 [Spatholobus suberectus]|nr:hypothetical protein E2542_SST08006 [Spatholobus suberectus]
MQNCRLVTRMFLHIETKTEKHILQHTVARLDIPYWWHFPDSGIFHPDVTQSLRCDLHTDFLLSEYGKGLPPNPYQPCSEYQVTLAIFAITLLRLNQIKTFGESDLYCT